MKKCNVFGKSFGTTKVETTVTEYYIDSFVSGKREVVAVFKEAWLRDLVYSLLMQEQKENLKNMRIV